MAIMRFSQYIDVARRTMHLLHQDAGFAIKVAAVHALVALEVRDVHKCRCRIGDSVLHQDRGLLQLFVQGVSIVRVAVKAFGAHNRTHLEHGADVHLRAELVGRFALADEVHRWRTPGAELALSIQRLETNALSPIAFGFALRVAKRYLKQFCSKFHRITPSTTAHAPTLPASQLYGGTKTPRQFARPVVAG